MRLIALCLLVTFATAAQTVAPARSMTDPEKMAALEKMRAEKNSFWPKVEELGNKWTGIVLGFGVLGVVVEEVLREYVY